MIETQEAQLSLCSAVTDEWTNIQQLVVVEIVKGRRRGKRKCGESFEQKNGGKTREER